MAKRANNDKLRLWQDRLSRNESAYESEASRMDEREALYAGVNQLRAIVRGERKTQTPHVRNICAELIEAQTDSNIPQPKVTARRKKDEMKAKLIGFDVFHEIRSGDAGLPDYPGIGNCRVDR